MLASNNQLNRYHSLSIAFTFSFWSSLFGISMFFVHSTIFIASFRANVSKKMHSLGRTMRKNISRPQWQATATSRNVVCAYVFQIDEWIYCPVHANETVDKYKMLSTVHAEICDWAGSAVSPPCRMFDSLISRAFTMSSIFDAFEMNAEQKQQTTRIRKYSAHQFSQLTVYARCVYRLA